MDQIYDREQQRSGESGMTFAEMMVVLVLLGVILAAVWMVFGATNKMSDFSNASMTSQDENRAALDRISLDVREGQGLQDSGNLLHIFTIINPREMTLFSQVDSDTTVERIHYYVSGNDLYRATSQQSATTSPAYPGSWTSEVPLKLVNDLSPAYAGAIFTYYGSAGTSPSITTVTAVNVHLVTAFRSGSVTATTDSSSLTTVRSVVGQN